MGWHCTFGRDKSSILIAYYFCFVLLDSQLLVTINMFLHSLSFLYARESSFLMGTKLCLLVLLCIWLYYTLWFKSGPVLSNWSTWLYSAFWAVTSALRIMWLLFCLGMSVLLTFFTPQQQVQTNDDNNCANYAEAELYEHDFLLFQCQN